MLFLKLIGKKVVPRRVALIILAALDGAAFGYAITRSYFWLLLLTAGVYSVVFIEVAKQNIKQMYTIYFIYNLIAGLSLTLWFTKITATGWFDSIGAINIKAWLVIFLIIASLISAVILSFIGVIFSKLVHKNQLKLSHARTALLFSAMMTATEIGRQILFSIIVQSNGTPIGPVWGIFSATTTLPASSFVSKIPAIYGYWGTSYFIYFCSAVIVSSVFILKNLHRTKNIKLVTRMLGCIAVIATSIVLSNILFPSHITENNNISLNAVATSTSDNSDYVADLKSVLEKRNKSKYTIVALPEYDPIIHPDKNTPSLLVPDARTNDLFSIDQKNVYYVATQDDAWNYQKYAINYLGNKDSYIIKKSKNFLVPGGEYVVGWINQILTPINPLATLEFKKMRGRHVIDSKKINQDISHHPLKDIVSIGSCSSVLSPYIFRADVNNGAQLIALNLSFAQFANAPEYELFSKKFMLFMAHAYQRPIIAGVHDGQALYVSPYSNKDLQQASIISDDVPYNKSQTIYTRLGDLYILLILASLTAISQFYPIMKRRLHAKNLQNRR